MTVERDVIVRAAERRGLEQKIRAVEEWNNLLLESAKRGDMYSYAQSKNVLKEMPNSGAQLSLWSDDELLLSGEKSSRKFWELCTLGL